MVYTIEANIQYTGFHGHSFFVDNITSVTAEDDYTVKFVLKQPNSRFHPTFLDRWGCTRIMPKHVFEKEADPTLFTDNPYIGCGPYKLHSFEPNGYWTAWERREDWDKSPTGILYGQPVPKYIIYQAFTNEGAQILSQLTHQLDVAELSADGIMFGRITQGSVYLDDVVSDICKRSGLETADINVAQLSSDVVKGYCVSQDQSAREAIEPFMEAYIFDGVEVDGVLTFVKRGGASVVTIPEADLACHRLGEERPELLEIEFPDETELPRRLEVHYPDIDRKHEPGVQHYQRQVTDSKLIKKIQTPILMDADQAKQLAHVAFKYFWTGKPCTLSLGPKYARLMPCDVITVQKTEGDYRVLLLEAQREGLLTNWKGLIEEIDYTSTITGAPAPAVDNDVFFVGPSIYYLLDLPPLLDAHDQAGVYMASGALFSDWHGGEVYVSKDSGDTWTYLKSLASRAKTGVVTAAFDDHEFVARGRHSAMTIRWD